MISLFECSQGVYTGFRNRSVKEEIDGILLDSNPLAQWVGIPGQFHVSDT